MRNHAHRGITGDFRSALHGDGDYVFTLHGRILYRATRLGFLVDVDGPVLLKHGPVEEIERYRDIAIEAFAQIPASLRPTLVLIEGDTWDIEEVTRYVECAGSIRVELEKLGYVYQGHQPEPVVEPLRP
jgi:hypothetical protein